MVSRPRPRFTPGGVAPATLALAACAATLALAGPAPGAATVRCRPTNHPGGPVRFLPGGVQVVARGPLPGGAQFTISAERYRFQGCVDFNLAIGLQRPGTAIPLSGGGSSFAPSPSAGVFVFLAQLGCTPRPYAVVFGLLRTPSDSVLATAGGRSYALRHVAIPASFGAGGQLAYAALPARPSEIRVRTPAGANVQDDRISPPPRGRCMSGALSVF